MSYQVVETVQSVLEAKYDSIEDFKDNTTFDGTSRVTFVTDTYNRLIDNGLATQEEADRYVQIATELTIVLDEWNTDNQSYTSTRIFESEDDYIFLELMYERAYSYFRNNMRQGLYTITRV